MKVENITLEYEDTTIFILDVDGESCLKYDDQDVRYRPEDLILTRDMSMLYNIADLMKLAYEAGQRGDTFEIIHTRRDKTIKDAPEIDDEME